MRFAFTVYVEVERESGKFASKYEVEEQLLEAIEFANPDSVDGVGADGDTTYTVIDWEVLARSVGERQVGQTTMPIKKVT